MKKQHTCIYEYCFECFSPEIYSMLTSNATVSDGKRSAIFWNARIPRYNAGVLSYLYQFFYECEITLCRCLMKVFKQRHYYLHRDY